MATDSELKTLSEKLEKVKHDPYLTNLYYRYYQGLELGYSHFRDSMYLDRFSCGVESMSENPHYRSYTATIEEEILQNHPNCDACQMRLLERFSRQNGD